MLEKAEEWVALRSYSLNQARGFSCADWNYSNWNMTGTLWLELLHLVNKLVIAHLLMMRDHWSLSFCAFARIFPHCLDLIHGRHEAPYFMVQKVCKFWQSCRFLFFLFPSPQKVWSSSTVLPWETPALSTECLCLCHEQINIHLVHLCDQTMWQNSLFLSKVFGGISVSPD